MARADAIKILEAGIDAVKPKKFIPKQVQWSDGNLHVAGDSVTVNATQRLFVAAAGKAAAAMAFEVEKIVGPEIHQGLVITKYEHALALQYFETIEAGHPLPDANSITAGKRLVQLFEAAGANDSILFLISGGASALVSDLPGKCMLQDIAHTVKLLLDCGADIYEMNTVRKHLSRIKGGQLVRYTKAKIYALVLSDVPGDDLSAIASGLTVADTSSFEDAWKVLEKYDLTNKIPAAVFEWLQQGLQGTVDDTPKTGDPIFRNVRNTLVATNAIALKAAAATATALGYNTSISPKLLQGDAAAQAMAFTQQLLASGEKKACYLWGGETTVIVRGKGKGGRNQHFALSALDVLQNSATKATADIVIAAGGTDGTDGPTDATGAIADKEVIDAAVSLKFKASEFLQDNDAYHFFEKTGGLITTGPTQTNVMDMIVGLVNRT